MLMELVIKVIVLILFMILVARLSLDYIMAAFFRKKFSAAIEHDKDKFVDITASVFAKELLKRRLASGNKKDK